MVELESDFVLSDKELFKLLKQIIKESDTRNLNKLLVKLGLREELGYRISDNVKKLLRELGIFGVLTQGPLESEPE
jgi:hypothetical protein